MSRAADIREFRNALGGFATGVTIITTVDHDGNPVGLTASSFNWVSKDPPLILFSLDKSAYSLAAFTNYRHFAVNVLREGQEGLSNRFAASLGDKWTGIEHSVWDSGCPILEDCLASFECQIRNTYDGGDHMIFVGEVLKLFSQSEGRPLVFHRGRYWTLDVD